MRYTFPYTCLIISIIYFIAWRAGIVYESRTNQIFAIVLFAVGVIGAIANEVYFKKIKPKEEIKDAQEQSGAS